MYWNSLGMKRGNWEKKLASLFRLETCPKSHSRLLTGWLSALLAYFFFYKASREWIGSKTPRMSKYVGAKASLILIFASQKCILPLPLTYWKQISSLSAPAKDFWYKRRNFPKGEQPEDETLRWGLGIRRDEKTGKGKKVSQCTRVSQQLFT